MRNCPSYLGLLMVHSGTGGTDCPKGGNGAWFYSMKGQLKLKGIRCLQYADNVLIGVETLEELRSLALQVFERFDEFGIKVNYNQVKWVTEEIEFLGSEISNGYWSHENFLKSKRKELGEIRTIKDLERIIGVISYARRCVKDVEVILGPLREDLKEFKAKSVSKDWIEARNRKVDKALAL